MSESVAVPIKAFFFFLPFLHYRFFSLLQAPFFPLFLSHTHTLTHPHAHTHTHARTHARTHSHTHVRAPTRAHTHTHTHTHMHARTHARTRAHARIDTHILTTNTFITGDVFGRMRRKKVKNRYAEGKRWVFSSDVKEDSEKECLTERGREFQITGPMFEKDLTPRVPMPILGTRKIRVFEVLAK